MTHLHRFTVSRETQHKAIVSVLNMGRRLRLDGEWSQKADSVTALESEAKRDDPERSRDRRAVRGSCTRELFVYVLLIPGRTSGTGKELRREDILDWMKTRGSCKPSTLFPPPQSPPLLKLKSVAF